MKGTLELLCGPSAVGKSSSLDNRSKTPYTYTTRKPRNEKDAKTRRFVTEEEFEALVQEGQILAPYEAFGKRYGFSADLREALKRGENVAEQIVPFDAIEQVVQTFEGFGQVRKKLCLTSAEDMQRRLTVGRSDRSRTTDNIEILGQYLMGLDTFDDFEYIYPEALTGEEAAKVVDDIIAALIQSKPINLEYDNLDASFSHGINFMIAAGMADELIQNLNMIRRSFSEGLDSLFHTYPCLGPNSNQITRIGLINAGTGCRVFDDLFGLGLLFDQITNRTSGDLFDRIESDLYSISQTGKVIIEDLFSLPLRKYLIEELQKTVPVPKNFPPDFKVFNSSYFTLPLLAGIRMGNILIDLNKKSSLFHAMDSLIHTYIILEQQERIYKIMGLIAEKIKIPRDYNSLGSLMSGRKKTILKFMDMLKEPQDRMQKELGRNEGASQMLNTPIDVGDLSMSQANALNLYCCYRRDFPEIYVMIAHIAKEAKEASEQLALLQSPLTKYALFENNRFLEDAYKIKTSDPGRPNSRSNLWSYPFRGNAQEFLQEYWVFNYPEKDEIMKRIQDNYQRLGQVLKIPSVS